METKWKQDILASQTLESCCEFRLGETEGMAEVKTAIHVRIGESDQIFGKRVSVGIKFRISFKGLVLFPFGLDPLLNISKMISSCKRLCTC